MEPVRITLRAPRKADLAIGRGEPSGPGGKWRVFNVEPLRMVLYYSDREVVVASQAGWNRAPKYGLQVISACGGVWKGADEYRMGGVSKFGLYLEDAEYEAIEAKARG